ncbi:universal stress protein [Streptomyces sp. NPDC020983]|uniref:universal stress protein n=1 Tax=Streptomyces sp. NPDC020983 TaxID=3365106 RepID=UPI0037A84FDD
MSPPQVVVGIDGSVPSFGALDVAAGEARLRTARLDVITCVGDPDEAGPVLRAAAARLARRHPGVPVTTSSAVGDPAAVLAERGAGAALTVVGSRHVRGAAGLLLHSVSRRLAARTVAPLLVVPGAGLPTAPRRHRAGGLLLGLESDADADAALFAFEEAALRGARLDVLHAWTYRPPPPGAAGGRPGPPHDPAGHRAGAGAASAAGLLAPLCRSSPHQALHSGTVPSTPCRALIAATSQADLVVIGTRAGRGGNGSPPGPVARALLRHAHCPVVLVPALAAGGRPGG